EGLDGEPFHAGVIQPDLGAAAAVGHDRPHERRAGGVRPEGNPHGTAVPAAEPVFHGCRARGPPGGGTSPGGLCGARRAVRTPTGGGAPGPARPPCGAVPAPARHTAPARHGMGRPGWAATCHRSDRDAADRRAAKTGDRREETAEPGESSAETTEPGES